MSTDYPKQNPQQKPETTPGQNGAPSQGKTDTTANQTKKSPADAAACDTSKDGGSCATDKTAA